MASRRGFRAGLSIRYQGRLRPLVDHGIPDGTGDRAQRDVSLCRPNDTGKLRAAAEGPGRQTGSAQADRLLQRSVGQFLAEAAASRIPDGLHLGFVSGCDWGHSVNHASSADPRRASCRRPEGVSWPTLLQGVCGSHLRPPRRRATNLIDGIEPKPLNYAAVVVERAFAPQDHLRDTRATVGKYDVGAQREVVDDIM